MWHVIECKGTQSGTTYRDRQLGNLGPPPDGGVAQKSTIEFPHGSAGQRIVCGLSIGFEGGFNTSNLRIIDPPAKESIVLKENDIVYVADAMSRSVGARALRLAGFSAASSILSAPSGMHPSDKPTKGHAEMLRQEMVAQKEAWARDELKNWETRNSSRVGVESYRVRSIEIDLPKPVGINERHFERVHLSHGVNDRFLDEVATNSISEGPHTNADVGWREMIGKTVIASEADSAGMKIGSLFFSEIALRN